MNLINYYGIWTVPVAIAITAIGTYMKDGKISLDLDKYIYAIVIALTISLYIYSKNAIAKKNGKNNFKMTDTFGSTTKADYQATERDKHLYPDVEDELLSNQPTGIIYGKAKGKYVCKSINQDGHTFVFGQSGAGKSSGIAIPTILSNENVAMFVLDIKGELNHKTQKRNDPNVIVINPYDRTKCGYNPLYSLSEESSEDEIVEVMEDIAITLIPIDVKASDNFWKLSARNLLIGLMTHLYQQGHLDLATIISIIRKKELKAYVKEIIKSVDEDSAVNEYLIDIANGADDTVAGIIAEVKSDLSIFRNPDIKYFLRDNPRRINPRELSENGKKIFLVVEEKKLAKISVLIRLIIEQFTAELMSRSELDDNIELKPVLFIIDELARVCSGGKLETLSEGIKTLRSKKVQYLLLTQTKEGLQKAFSEPEVEDLINNCAYKVITSSTSLKTDEWVCNNCGEFKERNISYGLGSNKSNNISFSWDKLVRPQDLTSLKKKKEFIIFTPYGYKRVRGALYFEEEIMLNKYSEIQKYNRTVKI